MGKVHKLKPEVRNFIIEQKKNAPALSCRTLAVLATEKLGVEISKSSINSLFKGAGLSLPIGRPSKKKRPPGAILNERIKFALQGPALALPEEIKPAAPPPDTILLLGEQNKEAKQAEDKAIIEKASPQENQAKPGDEETLQLKAQKEAAQAAAEEKLIREAEEKSRLAEGEARQLGEKEQQEEVLRQEEERAAQELALKAEQEKWSRLAEEELKNRQLSEKDVAPPPAQKADKPVVANVMAQNMLCCGWLLLKAVDSLVGGSRQINEAICRVTGNNPGDTLIFTEALAFAPLLKNDDLACLYSLAGKEYNKEKLDEYSAGVEQSGAIKLDTFRVLSDIFTEARGVKLHFVGGDTVYLDGQLHTTWAIPNIADDFSSTLYCLKERLKSSFLEHNPLVLFMAPGYDMLAKEFFNLLLNMSAKNKGPEDMVLYGNKLEELERLSLDPSRSYPLVFGLWPWQYVSYRKVKRIGEFSLCRIKEIGRDFYLADIEVDLIHPSTGQKISVKGCALKTDLQEKVRLAILESGNNFKGLSQMAGEYLRHWPNLEESFQDFSRKIELFTYAGNAQNPFSADISLQGNEAAVDLKAAFSSYIKILDAYLRRYFLPVAYRNKDLGFMSEQFYKLSAGLFIEEGHATVRMQVPSGYQFSEDLQYLSRRLNERRIKFGSSLWLRFENVFK